MIFRVRHETRYRYSRPVDLGAHIVHMQPRPLPFQRVLSTELLAEPTPTLRRAGVDHFGNVVTWMFLDRPHPTLDVLAEAQVEVRLPDPPPPGDTPPWEQVAALAGGADSWRAAEFLFDSPMVTASAAAAAYAAPSFPPRRPVLEGLLDLTRRFRAEFAFRSGVTTIGTSVATVLERREGVCQDFSHVMIAALRALGLPARYVSGYIRTYPSPGQERRDGADMSHAWVGAWLGPAHGWVDLDPTNNLVVRDEHVVLGWGRDFSDVSPLRGVILGGGRHALSVSVDLRPET
jgi:transglutaminase-like putative cysteine protease